MINLTGVVVQPGATLNSIGPSPGQAPVDPQPYLHFLNPRGIEDGTGSATQLLAARGAGFKTGDVIVFNGVNQTTTFVDATTLTAVVDLTALTAAAPVKVKRATYLSRTVQFLVVPAGESVTPQPAPEPPPEQPAAPEPTPEPLP